MIGLDITTTADDFRRRFGALAEKQIPFAVARSLTTLANDSRNEVISAMPRVFHLRNRRSLTSIKVERTQKTTDIGSMQAMVFVRDSWIAQHDEGREKTPQRSQTLFIPTGRGNRQGQRTRNPTGSTMRPMSPARLMAAIKSPGRKKIRPFLKELGGGKTLLLIDADRTFIGPRKRGDSGAYAIYLMIDRARIKSNTLPVRSLTEYMVRSRWPHYFAEYLDDAIKTAK